MKQWNIQQLNMQRINDINLCNDASERAMADSICKKEILELAAKKVKLSPVDIAILTDLFNPATLKAKGIRTSPMKRDKSAYGAIDRFVDAFIDNA